jgi:hypothetical protein
MKGFYLISCLFLYYPLFSAERAAVDTSSLADWIVVSKSGTLIGTVPLYNEALNKLEFTTELIAKKTFSEVHLKQDSLSNWYYGKLGLKGHFLILSQDSNHQTGEFVLYGTGKIKFFLARILVRFKYTQINDSLLYGTMSISVNKRFFLIESLLNKEVEKMFRYMQILGRNLYEDERLQQMLGQRDNAIEEKTVVTWGNGLQKE